MGLCFLTVASGAVVRGSLSGLRAQMKLEGGDGPALLRENRKTVSKVEPKFQILALCPLVFFLAGQG